MKYTIEFELPDNETVLQGIKNEYVKWAVWGYSGLSKSIPADIAEKLGIEPKEG